MSFDFLKNIEKPISFQTQDGLTLNGFITFPPAPLQGVALILSGSGPVGEDGDVSSPFIGTGFQGKPAKLNHQIADLLAREGIATVRYGKRNAQSQSIPNLLSDAQIALQVLISQFPDLPVSLVGFSEGALLSVLLQDSRITHRFLFCPPLQSVDELLKYQFLEWPISILSKSLGVKEDQLAKQAFLSHNLDHLPVIQTPISELPFDEFGLISIEKNIRPLYQNFFAQIQPLLATPDFSQWYTSFKALGPISEEIRKILNPVYIYQGSLDSQVNPDYLERYKQNFPSHIFVRTFEQLGHCFAPMEGSIGEKKTSGPFENLVLEQLADDVRQSIQQMNKKRN